MSFIEEKQDVIRGLVARWVSVQDPDYDDIVQEAMIYVSKIESDKPDAPWDYLMGCAKMGIRRILSSERRWTGMDRTKGKSYDPLRMRDWNELPEPEGVNGSDLEDHHDHFAAVDWASLRPSIEEALEGVMPRDREIARRYMEGETLREAGLAMGLHPTTAASNFSRVRKALRADDQFVGRMRDAGAIA